MSELAEGLYAMEAAGLRGARRSWDWLPTGVTITQKGDEASDRARLGWYIRARYGRACPPGSPTLKLSQDYAEGWYEEDCE